MNFSYGVGDFLATVKLVDTVRENFTVRQASIKLFRTSRITWNLEGD